MTKFFISVMKLNSYRKERIEMFENFFLTLCFCLVVLHVDWILFNSCVCHEYYIEI